MDLVAWYPISAISEKILTQGTRQALNDCDLTKSVHTLALNHDTAPNNRKKLLRSSIKAGVVKGTHRFPLVVLNRLVIIVASV